ncbi:MAG: hypothetical protein ACI35W_07620 [Anaeroplasmataceae bacterium]
MYTIISIFLIIFELLIFSVLIINTKKKIRVTKGTFWYLASTFIVMFVIYSLGYIYINKGFSLFAFFELSSLSVKCYVLEFNRDYLLPLANDNILYKITIILNIILILSTVIGSIASMIRVNIVNSFRVFFRFKNHCDIVIGGSEDSIAYAKNNKNTVIITDSISKELRNDLILSGLAIINKDIENVKSLDFRKNTTYEIIVFNDSNQVYSKVANKISNIKKPISTIINISIETKVEEADIVKDLLCSKEHLNNRIFIYSFNKYELIAKKFVIENSIAKYLPNGYIDNNCLIDNNKKINVVLLGYGKVNQELLKMMIMQNQFVTLNNNKMESMPVNYYVIDNNVDKLNNDLFLRLTHDYDILKKKTSSDEYYPIFEKLCNLHIYNENSKSLKTVELLDEIIDEKSFTFIITSIGSDYENATYTNKLYSMLKDKGNIKVFARNKSNNFTSNNDVIYFGCEADVITHQEIVNETLTSLAMEQNKFYNKISDEKYDEIVKKYLELPFIEQYSNIYNSTSLYFKANLLGYSFEKNNKNGVSKDIFYQNYGELSNVYDDYIKVINSRNTLIFSEHQRWCAYYYLNGFEPMKKTDIYFDEKTIKKDFKKKQHAFLTDFYHLDDLHYYILEIENNNGLERNISDVETYQWDCSNMDNAYDTFTSKGYKAVKIER